MPTPSLTWFFHRPSYLSPFLLTRVRLIYLLVEDALAFSLAVHEIANVALTIGPLILSMAAPLTVFHSTNVFAAVYPDESPDSSFFPIFELAIIHVSLGANDPTAAMELVVTEPSFINCSVFLYHDTTTFSDHSS